MINVIDNSFIRNLLLIIYKCARKLMFKKLQKKLFSANSAKKNLAKLVGTKDISRIVLPKSIT